MKLSHAVQDRGTKTTWLMQLLVVENLIVIEPIQSATLVIKYSN